MEWQKERERERDRVRQLETERGTRESRKNKIPGVGDSWFSLCAAVASTIQSFMDLTYQLNIVKFIKKKSTKSFSWIV